jgi:hypothetical protein
MLAVRRSCGRWEDHVGGGRSCGVRRLCRRWEEHARGEKIM